MVLLAELRCKCDVDMIQMVVHTLVVPRHEFCMLRNPHGMTFGIIAVYLT